MSTDKTQQQYITKLPYPIQELGPLTGTPEEVYARATSLVDIFTKLCGLEALRLDAKQYGYTDCKTFVAANFLDPEAYLTVEHEISHIFFDSDLEMANEFNKIYISDMMQRSNVSESDPNAQVYVQALQGMIHNAWNCLEDHRVRSLWEDIYPGGGYFLKKRWENIAEHCMAEVASKDILAYVARTVATGQDTPEAPEQFRQCKPAIDAAKLLVQKADKKTCLAATRQLLDSIADILNDWAKQNNQPAHNNSTSNDSYEEDLLKHAKQVGLADFKDKDLSNAKKSQQKLDTFSKIVQLTGCTDSSVPQEETGAGDTKYNGIGAHDINEKPQDNGNGTYSDKKSRARIKASEKNAIKRLAKMARLAQQGNEKAQKEMEAMIKKGTAEMKRKIQAAKAELFESGPEKEASEEADKVEYESAAKAAGIKPVIVQNPPALPKASKGAYALQAELSRIRMSIQRKLRDDGDDIDIEAFIDAKLGDDLDDALFFTDYTKEKGMEILVLTDCSGSMYGSGIEMVDQAMADILAATTNLNVKCHLWAFSNSLYMFTKPGSVSRSGGGGTDLLPALDTAIEWANQSPNKRGIIMLTDGYPTSCRRRNSTGNPIQDMHNLIKEARKDDIVISILCINEATQQFIPCSCGGGAWLSRHTTSAECFSCKAPMTYTEDNSMYDEYFGKGNYAVVKNKKEIAKQLPNAARVLVTNHLKSCM